MRHNYNTNDFLVFSIIYFNLSRLLKIVSICERYLLNLFISVAKNKTYVKLKIYKKKTI